MNRLERLLTERRILSETFSVMSKGRFPKLKEGIYNIRADSLDITNILSHSADSDILVVAKLKLKLSYCGQVYFGIVHPESILH